MRTRFIMRCACVFMVLLLCLTATAVQTNAITEPNIASNPFPGSSVNESMDPVAADTANASISSPLSMTNMDIGNTASYTAVSSTATSTTPDPRMPTSDNCVYDKNAPGGIILIEANTANPSPENGYRVALWYDVYSCDYHWYRQNPDGTWSHKPGDYEVTNVDTHGNLIVDAKNQHTLYSTFVGYYYAVPFNVIASLESAPTQIIDAIGFYPDDFS